jgi:DNA-directed RNA polymerase specialized sigma subunit
MDYIREAIEYLKSYRDLEIAKMNLEGKVCLINTEINGQAISYKHTTGGSGAETDDILINKIFARDQAAIQLKETKRSLEHVDKVIQAFEQEHEQYGKLLRLWLIEKKSLRYTAEQLDITERHIHRIKNQALRQFSIQLFGIKAMR